MKNNNIYCQLVTNDKKQILDISGYKKSGLIESYLDCITKEIINSESIVFSVAYFKKSVIPYIFDAIDSEECSLKKMKIFCSFDFDLTEPDAIRHMLSLGAERNLDIQVYTPKFNAKNRNLGFHSKVYFFESKHEYSLLIGSANLSKSAWTTNSEFGILEKLPKNSKMAESHIGKITPWLESLENTFMSSNDKNFLKNLAKYEEQRSPSIDVEFKSKKDKNNIPSSRVGKDWIKITPPSRIRIQNHDSDIISNEFCIHPNGEKVIITNVLDRPAYAIQNYDAPNSSSQLQSDLLSLGVLSKTNMHADRPQKKYLCKLYKFNQQYAFSSIEEAVNAVYGFNYSKKN